MKKFLSVSAVFMLLYILLSPVITAFADTMLMPPWYPPDVSAFRDFHGQNLKRVVDNAGILTDEQERMLSEKAQEIVDSNNVGFVILTDKSTYGLSKEVYAADFFIFNGYGVGDDYSGVILFLCMEEGNRGWRTIALGNCEKIYNNEKLINDLDDAIEADIKGGNYYKAFDAYIDYTDYIIKHKKFPVSAETVAKSTGFGLIAGLISAAMRTSSMKKKMNIHPEQAAASYFTDNSINITNKTANFLYSSLTKTPRVSQTKSSGGGSSFGGGTSSSGHTFSGGGRDF